MGDLAPGFPPPVHSLTGQTHRATKADPDRKQHKHQNDNESPPHREEDSAELTSAEESGPHDTKGPDEEAPPATEGGTIHIDVEG